MTLLHANIRLYGKMVLLLRTNLIVVIFGNALLVYMLYAFWSSLFADRAAVAGISKKTAATIWHKPIKYQNGPV